MPWSDEAFRARVVQRCVELGISQRQALKAAGVAHDFLQTNPAHGRRIDTLEKIATVLNWDLPDILGVVPSGQIDPGLMAKAAYVARKVTRSLDNVDIAVEAQILTSAYNVLVEQPQTDRKMMDQLAKMMLSWVAAQARIPQIRELLSAEIDQGSKKPI